MGITSDLNDSALSISVNGKFDFGAHQDFRNAYEGISPRPDSYIIDMGSTTYLDSSALGMLLLLRDYAGGNSSDILIKNCNAEIRKILSISNFEQLFKID